MNIDFSKVKVEEPVQYFSQVDGELAGFDFDLKYNSDKIGFFKYRINSDMEAHHAVELAQEYTGIGLGKLLLLRAIEIANDIRPRDYGFIGDVDVTNSQRKVYAALRNSGIIADGTNQEYDVLVSSEQYLEQLKDRK